MNNAKRGSTVPHIRRRTIALAVAGACAALVLPAHAQQTPTDPAPQVVVTGVRASMQSTLNLKRNSDGIVADDIGKFPIRTWRNRCSASRACRSTATAARAPR
jgi:hypothetical protein